MAWRPNREHIRKSWDVVSVARHIPGARIGIQSRILAVEVGLGHSRKHRAMAVAPEESGGMTDLCKGGGLCSLFADRNSRPGLE